MMSNKSDCSRKYILSSWVTNLTVLENIYHYDAVTNLTVLENIYYYDV